MREADFEFLVMGYQLSCVTYLRLTLTFLVALHLNDVSCIYLVSVLLHATFSARIVFASCLLRCYWSITSSLFDREPRGCSLEHSYVRKQVFVLRLKSHEVLGKNSLREHIRAPTNTYTSHTQIVIDHIRSCPKWSLVFRTTILKARDSAGYVMESICSV